MLPPSLIAYADRLAGVSTNHIRLEPQGARSGIRANQTIRFTLPSNTLLKMDSFAVHFAVTAIGENNGAARLPPDLGLLFDRVEVAVGGVQLSAGCNYLNVLRAAKRALMSGPSVDRGTDLVMTHGEMIRKQSYINNGAVGASETVNDATVRDFGGLLSENTILDTSLVGDIVVTLHTAPDGALAMCDDIDPTVTSFVSKLAQGTAYYVLSNVRATCEVMAVTDPDYATLVQKIISERRFYELPYKNVHSSMQTHNGNSRWNVSTQSLDRVWVAFRAASDANAFVAPKRIAGYEGDTYHAEQATFSGEKYVPGHFALSCPSSEAAFQLSVNGSLYPQFPATKEEWVAISENSLPPGHKLAPDLTLANYEGQRFALCARFNAPGAESARSISGLDTRGLSLVGQVVTQNDQSGGSHQCFVFAETTASLRIGAGRVVEVVM